MLLRNENCPRVFNGPNFLPKVPEIDAAPGFSVSELTDCVPDCPAGANLDGLVADGRGQLARAEVEQLTKASHGDGESGFEGPVVRVDPSDEC